MDNNIIKHLNRLFEESAYEQDGIEYWLARELQELLDYTQWRNFQNVIEKAKDACINSGNLVSDHFADVSKTIPMPKGANKQIDDVILTRFACYLIAQNGDPKIEQIAFAANKYPIRRIFAVNKFSFYSGTHSRL